jgi:endonuclease-3 related protein
MTSQILADRLLNIYNLLLDHFNHRNWWPGESPFEVIIGAILTQNTNWGNVVRTINNLKVDGRLSPDGILSSPDNELGELIRPSGYYNQKALKLKRVTGWWINKDETKDTQTLRRELLDLNGVGPETADSILLYALGRPVFVIDAYTKRIFSRIGITSEEATYTEMQSLFHDNLPADAGLFNDYHAQLVALGKHFCRKKPLCGSCPVRKICSTGMTTA